MEEPTPLGHYLGCNHVQGTVALPNGNTAKTVTYDMEEFLDFKRDNRSDPEDAGRWNSFLGRLARR